MSETRRVFLGKAEDLTLGQSKIVSIPKLKPPKNSVIFVMSGVGPRAYWNVCRHLPIPLDGGTGELGPGPDLQCLTHGAVYRPEDGHCTEGPCEGDQLEAVDLHQEGNQFFIELDDSGL